MTQVTIERELLAHLVEALEAVSGWQAHQGHHRDAITAGRAALQAAPAQPVNQVLFEDWYENKGFNPDWKVAAKTVWDAAQAQAQPAQGLTDGERYRAVIGMSGEQMLRFYNTRPDLREAFIDAAIQKGQQS